MFSSSRKDQSLTPARHYSPKVAFLPKAEPKAPRIIVSRQAYAQMNLYVEIAKEEVGWMGTVKRQENGDFLIEKCFLFSQKVHPTETEISNEGFSELSMELLDGVLEGDEANWDVNKLRFWGHSHVYMGTSPSMTDEQTMLNDYGTGRSSNTGQARFCFEDSGYPWVIRGIFNKMGDALFSVFLFEEGYRFDNVEWTVEEPTAEQIAFHKAADQRAEEERRAQSVSWVKQLARPAAVNEAGEGKASEALDDNDEKSNAVKSDVAAGDTTGADADLAGVTTGGVKPVLSNMRMPGDSAVPQFGRPQEEAPRYGGGGLFNRPLFEKPRDMKYRPDITPELRAAVQADFDKKVTSRSFGSSWWGGGKSSTFGGDEARSEPRVYERPRYGQDRTAPVRFERHEPEAVLSAEDAEREAGLQAMAHATACYPAGNGDRDTTSDTASAPRISAGRDRVLGSSGVPTVGTQPKSAGDRPAARGQCAPWAEDRAPEKADPSKGAMSPFSPAGRQSIFDEEPKSDGRKILDAVIGLFRSKPEA